MTKRIYKTAKELGIKEGEKRALLNFAKFLAKENPIQPVRIPGDGMFRFNMNSVVVADSKHEEYITLKYKKGETRNDLYEHCGTAGCIWGGAHLLAINSKQGKSPFGRGKWVPYTKSYRLDSLFYPYDVSNWRYITPQVASKTTIHFLKTGEVDFKKFMGAHYDKD